MSKDLTLSMKLYADASRFVSGLVAGERGVRKFTGGVKAEFDALKGALKSVEGRFASLGVSVGAVAAITQSARMDKSLTQIGQSAGASHADVQKLRKELFSMASDTGQAVDDLQVGFNNAVQSGLSFAEALPVISAANKAMALTGASADVLTSSLTVASAAFGFDLSRPGLALELLDKMTVATRFGSEELGNLSSIFATIAVNASRAGMGFDQTLGFIEGLSAIERSPERLATMTNSITKLFTDANTMMITAKATGVKFFEHDASGKRQRRDPIAVLRDLKKEYDKRKDDLSRFAFMTRTFEGADARTIKGISALLGGDLLNKIDKFPQAIAGASGAVERDLPDAISNSVDQVSRLKTALREAADGFARPINETLSNAIKFAMDRKENGGLGLNGKDMILGGIAGGLGLFGAARYGGKAIGALTKRFGGTAAGVAEGKALEAAAGVQPVYVVNMPGSGLVPDALAAGAGGAVAAKAASKLKVGAALLGGSNLAALRMMGAGALGTAGLATTAAGATGYGIGTVINRALEWGLTRLTGKETSLGAMLYDLTHKEQEIGGTINIKIDSDGRPTITSMSPTNRNVRFNVDAGMTMAGAG